MNDARFLWCLLVPRGEFTELHEIPPDWRNTLFDEIELVSTALQEIERPDTLNIGALGNRVAQLHIHVIARHTRDCAWPDPVWGNGNPEPYGDDTAAGFVTALRNFL